MNSHCVPLPEAGAPEMRICGAFAVVAAEAMTMDCRLGRGVWGIVVHRWVRRARSEVVMKEERWFGQGEKE